MLDLTVTNRTRYKAFGGPFFKQILKLATKEVRLGKRNVGLSINLVTKAKIRALNKKYRNKDKPTDVLSFPLHNLALPNKSKEHILELGDIFICPDVLIENVKKEIYPVQDREGSQRDLILYGMQFVVVHGFLHLLGYDHEKSGTEEKKMFQLQNKILKKLK